MSQTAARGLARASDDFARQGLAERCEPNLGLALGQLAVRMLGNSQIPPRTNVILICLFRTRKKPIFCWMKSLN